LHLGSVQLEWAQRATDLAPDDPRTHGQAGDAFLSSYRLDEAIREYTIAKKLRAEPFGDAGLARVLRIRGRLDEALQVCIDTRSKYPDHPEIYRTWALQGEVLRDMWRLEEALAIYREAQLKFPDEPVLWCGTAAVLRDMGALSEALASYDAAAKRFPSEAVPRGGYADTLKNLGHLTLALSEYNSAIAEFPDETVLICGKADVLRTMGRFDEAAAVYKFAISRFPFEPTAYCGYADTQRDSGNISGALEAYDNAIRAFSDDSRCRTGRADILRFAGRFEESLQAFDQATRNFPYDLYGLVRRANLLKLLGHYQDALNAYEVVIQRRPDYAPARYGKAAVFVLMKEFGAADQLLPSGEARTSAEWVGLHIRGMMDLKKGHIDKAIEVLTRGIVDNPFHREQQFFKTALAAAEIRKKHYREAVDLVLRIDDPISHVLRMHSLAELGDSPHAQLAYHSVNDNAPPNVTLLKDAIAGYYGLGKQKASYSNGWILEQEMEVLLQAA
jgi:tetratricopeptide (TPR) repeat protein